MSKGIKIEELRRGNYVGYRHLDEKKRVHLFATINGIDHRDEWSAVSLNTTKHIGTEFILIDSISAIPIDTDWLENLGFENDGRMNYQLLMQKCRFGFRFIDGRPNCLDVIQDDNRISFAFGQVNKVHKLQNLYYALTGDELEIK